MRSMSRHGLKNSLIRWVHRHDRIATLFRSTVQGSQYSSWPRGVYSAREAPIIQPPYDEAFNEDTTREPPIVFSSGEKPGKTAPIQSAQAAASQAFKHTVTPNKPLSSRSSDSQNALEEPDHEWRRLQAILRKHEEQADTKPSGDSEPATIYKDT